MVGIGGHPCIGPHARLFRACTDAGALEFWYGVGASTADTDDDIVAYHQM
jgi:hypothetical protein